MPSRFFAMPTAVKVMPTATAIPPKVVATMPPAYFPCCSGLPETIRLPGGRRPTSSRTGFVCCERSTTNCSGNSGPEQGVEHIAWSSTTTSHCCRLVDTKVAWVGAAGSGPAAGAVCADAVPSLEKYRDRRDSHTSS